MSVMKNVLEGHEQAGRVFTGMTFQPGLPPLIDPLRFIGWREVGDAWEIITTGLSEFGGKETSDPSRSGFGIEFVLRIGRRADETEPPEAWTLPLFQSLGRIVFWSSQVPAEGSVVSFAPTMELHGTTYRFFDESQGFGTEARPLDFTHRDGPLARIHDGLRRARHEGDTPPTAGRRFWNTPVADAFSGLGFVSDPTFGVMETETGPVRWVRCLALREGETVQGFAADGVVQRPG
jgi:hypothetical protein